MNIKNLVMTAAVVGFAVSVAMDAGADAARTVAWEELSIKLTPADNPFLTLSTDQLVALSDVAGIRARKARGVALTAEESAIENKAVAKLKQDHIDADALLAKRDAIAGEKRAAASTLNRDLDGKLVRLAGYVLPLEFSAGKVTEFLLVPWVGACIHTPPPEPNQIVYVKPDSPFEVRRMFDAVWVTGRIAAVQSKRTVEIVDGSADIDVGYSIRGSKVELY
jgi:hypothetical protein